MKLVASCPEIRRAEIDRKKGKKVLSLVAGGEEQYKPMSSRPAQFPGLVLVGPRAGNIIYSAINYK